MQTSQITMLSQNIIIEKKKNWMIIREHSSTIIKPRQSICSTLVVLYLVENKFGKEHT